MPLSKVAEAYDRGENYGFDLMVKTLANAKPAAETKPEKALEECEHNKDCPCQDDDKA